MLYITAEKADAQKPPDHSKIRKYFYTLFFCFRKILLVIPLNSRITTRPIVNCCCSSADTNDGKLCWQISLFAVKVDNSTIVKVIILKIFMKSNSILILLMVCIFFCISQSMCLRPVIIFLYSSFTVSGRVHHSCPGFKLLTYAYLQLEFLCCTRL